MKKNITLKNFQKNNLILLNINNLSYLEETIEIMKENLICFINHDEVYEYSTFQKFNKNSMDEYLIFLKDKGLNVSNLENFFKFFENQN